MKTPTSPGLGLRSGTSQTGDLRSARRSKPYLKIDAKADISGRLPNNKSVTAPRRANRGRRPVALLGKLPSADGHGRHARFCVGENLHLFYSPLARLCVRTCTTASEAILCPDVLRAVPAICGSRTPPPDVESALIAQFRALRERLGLCFAFGLASAPNRREKSR